MLLELDLEKNAKNIRERGIGFERFADLNLETAVYSEDARREPMHERSARMRKNASRPDDENPEWTAEEIRNAKPFLESLPPETLAAVLRYRGQRGPQKEPTKELISLRVDRDVVEAFRASGAGWQTRANEALRVYAKNRLTRTRTARKPAGRKRAAGKRVAKKAAAKKAAARRA